MMIKQVLFSDLEELIPEAVEAAKRDELDIPDDQTIWLGYWEGDTLLGIIGCYQDWVLCGLYVKNKHTEQGIGQKLVHTGTEYLKLRNQRIYFWTTVNYSSERLFERAGWLFTGEFYKGHKVLKYYVGGV